MNSEQFQYFMEQQNKALLTLVQSVHNRSAANEAASASARPVAMESSGIYFNFDLTPEQLANPEEALAAIKAKVVRERNQLVDWLDFFSMQQQPIESIDEFVSRMKLLARLCQFGDLEEKLITYKIATSNKWQKLCTKFLTMSELTEVKAVNLCWAEEITEQHSATKSEKSDSDYDTDDSQSETSDESSDGDSDAEKVTIGKIHDHSKAGGHVLADLDLKIGNKWQSHQCELDTGANTSLVSFDWLTKVTGNPNPKLNPSKFNLQSFGGGEIPVKGEVTIPCRRNGRKYNLLLQVVNVSHRPLLSANVCKILGFVQFCNSVSFTSPQSDQDLLNIYRIRAQAIIDQHPKVFDGYGRFSGCVSLEIDPNVPPSIQQPRRIPIALRPKLKKELKKLEKDGIIVKETSPTDWVSNIVLVKRGSAENECLRICLDPIPLNRALKRPHLQFTTIDEILPELSRAKVFSTVDARKGFWHVVLEEKSSKLTTFWTPFGRYRWVRLPFGIAPAPEIFQMKLQEVVQDIEGVECLVDDRIVFGVGDTLLEALENHSE
ncbi:uncharacterized protein K02A2.6-like [Uranotaenia lowii]|uniref:uncharacterized protein K02A2.6-like n=1 Tax=Uranotaenia lowii TaxID=190385 RepID=UPI0024792451|nr:uncharacterized protein K02A2.6-like [Uranotaenia lowii]